MLMEKGKTFIFGTKDCLLIEKAFSHTAYLAGGKIIYQGTVKNLRLQHDRVLLMVRDKNISQIREKLAPLFPDHKLFLVGDRLLISDCGATNSDPLYIYEKIIGKGFAPQHISINPKTVQNAYKEIGRQHDLQNQLF